MMIYITLKYCVSISLSVMCYFSYQSAMCFYVINKCYKCYFFYELQGTDQANMLLTLTLSSVSVVLLGKYQIRSH